MATVKGRGISKPVLNWTITHEGATLRVDDADNPELWFTLHFCAMDVLALNEEISAQAWVYWGSIPELPLDGGELPELPEL